MAGVKRVKKERAPDGRCGAFRRDPELCARIANCIRLRGISCARRDFGVTAVEWVFGEMGLGRFGGLG